MSAVTPITTAKPTIPSSICAVGLAVPACWHKASSCRHTTLPENCSSTRSYSSASRVRRPLVSLVSAIAVYSASRESSDWGRPRLSCISDIEIAITAREPQHRHDQFAVCDPEGL